MANSNLVTREDLKNVFGALGEGDYGTRIDALEPKVASLESQLLVNINISPSTGSVSPLRCTGTIAATPYFYTNAERTFVTFGGRLRINNFTRTSSNPGVTFQSSIRPTHLVTLRGVGIRGSNTAVYPEYVYGSIETSGLVTLVTTESFANAPSGTMTFMFNDGLISIV